MKQSNTLTVHESKETENDDELGSREPRAEQPDKNHDRESASQESSEGDGMAAHTEEPVDRSDNKKLDFSMDNGDLSDTTDIVEIDPGMPVSLPVVSLQGENCSDGVKDSDSPYIPLDGLLVDNQNLFDSLTSDPSTYLPFIGEDENSHISFDSSAIVSDGEASRDAMDLNLSAHKNVPLLYDSQLSTSTESEPESVSSQPKLASSTPGRIAARESRQLVLDVLWQEQDDNREGDNESVGYQCRRVRGLHGKEQAPAEQEAQSGQGRKRVRMKNVTPKHSATATPKCSATVTSKCSATVTPKCSASVASVPAVGSVEKEVQRSGVSASGLVLLLFLWLLLLCM